FLAYYDYATRIEGFRNSYALDLDVESAPEEVDWDSMTPQQGDDPNLLILQFYHYYRATGNTDFVRRHYGFLRRNLTGQKHTDYHLPFHGDETFQVFVMMAEGAPMKDFFTADTGFEYVAAARAMSEMAAVIGEDADAKDFAARAEECRLKTEEHYWNDELGYYIPYVKKDTLEPSTSPFANINLRPLWIEYAPPGDANQRRNVINTAKKLMNRRGTMKSHARSAYYTGMTPGLLLYNLKAVGDMKHADLAYEGMTSRVISPTGEFAEAYDKNDRWINYGSAPTVLRPWESAINAEAVLYYITGLTYDHKADIATFQPHLPPGTDFLSIENLYAGRNRFTLLINKTEKGNLDIDIRNTGEKPATVQLITEPVPGVEPPDETEVFNSPPYERELWRRTGKLDPGEHLSASGGIIK
ncbi:MAG: trehalase family glycosidase, partial [bacterium]